jgi:hypothetical protein
MRDAGFDPEAFLAACLAPRYEAYIVGSGTGPLRSVSSILEALSGQEPDLNVNLLFRPMQ